MKHAILDSYHQFQSTSAGLGNLITTTGIFFEALLSSLDYFVKSSNIDLSILLLEVSVNYAVQFAQHFPQLGVEAVFDTIVFPEYLLMYLPGML